MTTKTPFDFITKPLTCLHGLAECPFHVAQGEIINLTTTREPCANCTITFGRMLHTPPEGFVRTNDIPKEV